MNALGSTFLAYLLAMLLAITPVSSEAGLATGELILRDVAVTLNGESYDLGVDSRFAYVTDGKTANLEFALANGEEKLFPARAAFDEETVTAMLDGMSRSFRVNLNDLMSAASPLGALPEDESMAAELAAMTEFQNSYKDLVTLALQKGNDEIEAEFAGIAEANIDRGEPVDTELEFDDGKVYATQCWTYSLTKDDIADLLDAVFASEGEFGAALNRYMNAAMALSGEALPEGGFAQFFRDEEDVDIHIDVIEHVNEAEALQYAELLIRSTAEGQTLEFPVYVMTLGDTQTVDAYLDFEGVSFGISTENTDSADGKSTLVDFSVQTIEVEDTGMQEYEPVTRPEEEADVPEEGEDAATENEEAPESGVENDLAALEDEGNAIIGGADEPTDVYVYEASSISATPVITGHFESYESPADENGTTTFDMVYRIEVYEAGTPITLSFACGGARTEAEHSLTGEADFTVYAAGQGVELKVTGTLAASFGAPLEIAAPAAEAVDPMNGEQAEIESLGAEALGLLLQDSGKLMEIEGVSNLIGAFSAVGNTAVESSETYEDNADDYDDAAMYEYTSYETIAEASAAFGQELPFSDEQGPWALTSASADTGVATLTYTCADEALGLPEINISVFTMDSQDGRYLLSEDGSLVADEQTVYFVSGDEEYGYWHVNCTSDGLQVDLYFSDSVDFDTVNASVAEFFAH